MGSLKVRDLFAGYWLRRRLLLLLLLALGSVGTAAVLAVPRQYRAQAVVAFRPQHPSADLVLPAVAILPEERFKTLHAELFAEPLLARLVDRLKLFPETRGEDARVAELRSTLEIKVEGDDVFSLEASAPDARLAAAEANGLVALYADGVRVERQRAADRVEEVFGPELAELRQELAEEDGAVERFKAGHVGRLPEELDGNLRAHDRVALLREREVEAMMDAERRRSALLQDGHDDATVLGRLRRRREDLTRELTEARSQWAGEHPEVQRLQRELAMVEREIGASETQRSGAALEIRTVEHQIAGLRAEEDELDRQAADYQRRVEATPAVADGLGRLVRSRDAVQTKYQALLGRQVEAELSADLARKEQPELFRIVQPASAPSRPAKPDRAAGVVLVWLAALVLSALAGAALELSDDSIRGAADARERLGVPVLAVVPSFSRVRLQPAARR